MAKMTSCPVCGGREFKSLEVLWDGLINEWQLARHEVEYVNRQQGEHCVVCNANLRSAALAKAILSVRRSDKTLAEFVISPEAANLKVLEINEAGSLSPILKQMPGHLLREYPDIDMHALPYMNETFDIVVHSDSLEHVPNPIHALFECRRVLKVGGALCYTVPTIIGRLSRDRSGLPNSYHGNPEMGNDDYVVHTEFGADVWTYPVQAGFTEVRLFSVEHPAALAIVAIRNLATD